MTKTGLFGYHSMNCLYHFAANSCSELRGSVAKGFSWSCVSLKGHDLVSSVSFCWRRVDVWPFSPSLPCSPICLQQQRWKGWCEIPAGLSTHTHAHTHCGHSVRLWSGCHVLILSVLRASLHPEPRPTVDKQYDSFTDFFFLLLLLWGTIYQSVYN